MREVTIKIGLERLDTQEGITVKALLDSGATGLVMSSEFARKKGVTNFIQLVPPQPVDRFSQTKLRWKAPNEGYPHICGMYKSNNK